MKNQTKRDVRRAANVKDTAEVMGVSTSLVTKTLAMERNNEKVVEVFMFLHEGKNLLLEEAKKLVPFN
jgi:prolyl-tRNA editing enzyme YbaK/EbsC (Cys-tRNA(Pro) deacylase)